MGTAHIHGNPVHIRFSAVGTFSRSNTVSNKFQFIGSVCNGKKIAVTFQAMDQNMAAFIIGHGLQFPEKADVFNSIRAHIPEQAQRISTWLEHKAAHKRIVDLTGSPRLIGIKINLKIDPELCSGYVQFNGASIEKKRDGVLRFVPSSVDFVIWDVCNGKAFQIFVFCHSVPPYFNNKKVPLWGT